VVRYLNKVFFFLLHNMKKETAEEKLTQLKQRIIAKQDELKVIVVNLI